MTAVIQNEICFRYNHLERSWDIDTYLKQGGYDSLKKVLSGEISADKVIEELKISNLRGRGGAGFPTGLKWSFMPRNRAIQRYILCNSDEGEPGTCKDRDIMRYNPHQLIEGMAIAGYVLGATQGYNYIRGEFVESIQRFNDALKQAYEHGFLGQNLQGSGFDFDLYYHCGAGSYICGEETALIESIEGKKGQPRFKPPYPASYGLYGKPTVTNNTETFASIPVIVEKSGQWFQDIGVEGSGGAKLFSVSGHVNKPGNYEIRMGTPFSDLLELAGGVRHGRKLKAVIPGGASTPVVPADKALDMNMDFNSISKAGSALGAGSVIVMDDSTDMVKTLECLAHFFHDESCGQCTPCREGTGWIYRTLRNIRAGKGSVQDLDLLTSLSNNINGNVICGLGDAAAVPVISFLKHFRQEFEDYINRT